MYFRFFLKLFFSAGIALGQCIWAYFQADNSAFPSFLMISFLGNAMIWAPDTMIHFPFSFYQTKFADISQKVIEILGWFILVSPWVLGFLVKVIIKSV